MEPVGSCETRSGRAIGSTEPPVPPFGGDRLPAIADAAARSYRTQISDLLGSAFCARRDGLRGGPRNTVGRGPRHLFVAGRGGITVDVSRSQVSAFRESWASDT